MRDIQYSKELHPDFHIYVHAEGAGDEIYAIDPSRGDYSRVTYKRNSQLSKHEIEDYMRDELGGTQAGLGRTTIQVCGTAGLTRMVYDVSRKYVSHKAKYQNCSY